MRRSYAAVAATAPPGSRCADGARPQCNAEQSTPAAALFAGRARSKVRSNEYGLPSLVRWPVTCPARRPPVASLPLIATTWKSCSLRRSTTHDGPSSMSRSSAGTLFGDAVAPVPAGQKASVSMRWPASLAYELVWKASTLAGAIGCSSNQMVALFWSSNQATAQWLNVAFLPASTTAPEQESARASALSKAVNSNPHAIIG